MITNKPVYKNPIFIILVAVLVLGGVVGIIGLTYYLNKSPTGNDDKPRNLGNGGETENEGGTGNSLNKGGTRGITENGGGTENPLNDGTGEGTEIKQSDNIPPKIIPDLFISAAQKGLGEFLAENKSLDSLPSFKLLTESGTNEAILQFCREYLEIRDVKDFKDAKPSNVLKALERYFGSFSTASEADGASFHLKLRQNLASFSLETINAHKILLSLRDSIADSVLLSPHQTAISILLQSLLEPKGCDPHQIFNTLLNSLTQASQAGMLTIISEYFVPFLKSLSKAEDIRLKFAPWQFDGREDRSKIFKDGNNLCVKWFNLLDLLLYSKPDSAHLEGAKAVHFDISKQETKNFIRECFEKQTLSKIWEVIITKLANFYNSDSPESSKYFNCVSKICSFQEEILRPEVKDAKDGFLNIIEMMFNSSDTEFFQLSKNFVKVPSVALLKHGELEKMFEVLETLFDSKKFYIKARFLQALLEVVWLIQTNSTIVAFVDQLEKLESVPSAELMTSSIEKMCTILPESVSVHLVYQLLKMLSKVYKLLGNSQLENVFLNYWQLLRLQNLLSADDIVTLENSLPVQVKAAFALRPQCSFEEYEQVLTKAGLGPITASSKLYEYLIEMMGITNFRGSKDYWQSLDNWIKKPVSDMLIGKMSDSKARLEGKLNEKGLKTNLSQLNCSNLIEFLFENNIVEPKISSSLLDDFFDYLSLLFARDNKGQFSEILKSCNISNEIICNKNIVNLFLVLVSFEKAKNPSSGQYDVNILDSINDNESAYMLWHAVFKPAISPEHPFNEEFLQKTLYSELKRLCTLEIQKWGYEYIIESSVPYFDPTIKDKYQ
jgi:hypothetical protein